MANLNTRRIRYKKMVNSIVIAMIVFCLLSMAGSAIIFSILFPRSELSPDSLELRYCDIDESKYPRKEVEFLSGKNTLHGCIYYTAGSPAIIVMAHGIRGGADSHLAEAQYFIDMGWSVFCFDGTGSRESNGNSTVGLSQMKLDLLAALDYLTNNYPTTPLLLYGHSMGAYSCASVLDDGYDVAGAVLISGFASTVDTMYYHARLKAGALALFGYPFLTLHNYVLFGEHADEYAIDSINSVDTPVLIIHGSQDQVIPLEISIYGKKDQISNDNVEFLIIEDEGRNRHSTAWLSTESALLHLHPDSITEFNRDKLHTTDEKFMEYINSFYLDSLKN